MAGFATELGVTFVWPRCITCGLGDLRRDVRGTKFWKRWVAWRAGAMPWLLPQKKKETAATKGRTPARANWMTAPRHAAGGSTNLFRIHHNANSQAHVQFISAK